MKVVRKSKIAVNLHIYNKKELKEVKKSLRKTIELGADYIYTLTNLLKHKGEDSIAYLKFVITDSENRIELDAESNTITFSMTLEMATTMHEQLGRFSDEKDLFLLDFHDIYINKKTVALLVYYQYNMKR